ncbi:phage tail protein [Desulfobaculum senezii]
MSDIMMKLGRYAFGLNSAAYDQVQRSTAYRWAAQERHGREAALQFLGPGEESISLSGVVYPHFRGGLSQVEDMRREAGQGKPLLLVDGLGRIHGRWVVLNVDETRGTAFADGVPRKIEFTLKLKYYGEADAVSHQGW